MTSDPVNLMETVDPDSSSVYIRRIVARTLGHAIADGMRLDEAHALWIEAGYRSDMWSQYVPTMMAADGRK